MFFIILYYNYLFYRYNYSVILLFAKVDIFENMTHNKLFQKVTILYQSTYSTILTISE